LFAYIPARGGSKRIPGKNIKDLGGLPILARVVETLKTLDFLSGVYVSTDDSNVREVAERSGAISLEPRSSLLSDDKAGFIDLMHHDLDRFAENNGSEREVLFVLATAALVPAKIYTEAHNVYREKKPDILMSCESFNSPPWWALTLDADGNWKPAFPEWILTNSQDLPPAVTDAGLFYFLNIDRMKRFDSHKTVNRMEAFTVPHQYSVDVDTTKDWEILEQKFEQLSRKE
jgi:pseudaminic acid cytidylyltransferase